jgi:hypothetical protein
VLWTNLSHQKQLSFSLVWLWIKLSAPKKNRPSLWCRSFVFRGSSHRRKSAVCPKFDLVWLHRSSIPVGRSGVISSFKLFLPDVATCRGREGGVGTCALHVKTTVFSLVWSLKSPLCSKSLSLLYGVGPKITILLEGYLPILYLDGPWSDLSDLKGELTRLLTCMVPDITFVGSELTFLL